MAGGAADRQTQAALPMRPHRDLQSKSEGAKPGVGPGAASAEEKLYPRANCGQKTSDQPSSTIFLVWLLPIREETQWVPTRKRPTARCARERRAMAWAMYVFYTSSPAALSSGGL